MKLRQLLIVADVAFIFGIVTTVRAQNGTCMLDPPYPVYNLSKLAPAFLVSTLSFPLIPPDVVIPIPPSCGVVNASDIVKFFCKTTNDSQWHEVDFFSRTNLDKLNKTAKWTMVIHGFLGKCKEDWTTEMVDVLAASEYMNVCCCDWSLWAQCNYVSDATIFVPKVGIFLAQVVWKILQYLAEGSNIDPIKFLELFILIGHSFGAQIIGICAKQFPPPCQFPRCIALDLAGYAFTKPYIVPANQRLIVGDCRLVKALYTDMYGLGSYVLTGGIDVIANGGIIQPHCGLPQFPCAHFSACPYFIESIRRGQTRDYPITNISGQIQDYYTLYGDKDENGVYYLTTGICYPYESPLAN